MTSICIIPARGGSKRIPKKNIRPFLGRPIILHSIDVARQCGLFSSIMVSSDDPVICDIAKNDGVHGMARPANLADDHMTTAQVLEHELKLRGKHFEYACCIYPCALFLEVADLTQGYELLRNSRTHSVFAAAKFESAIEHAFRWEESVSPDEALWTKEPVHNDTRSQDLPTWYWDVGMFYWVNVEWFLKEPTLRHPSSRAVIIPPERAIDIDTEDDWRRAEQMYRRLHDRAA